MAFREHTVALEDVEIHWLEWGEPGQRPVLLLHGYLDIAHGWVPFAEAMGEGYRIVAPSFRGHGKSGWTEGYGYVFYNYIYDWVQLLAHLGWERLDLVGHSMGANCASVLAGTCPDRIRRLVLLEGFGVPGWTADDIPERLASHIERRLPAQRKANRVFASLDDVVARIQQSNPRYPADHARMLAKHGAYQRDDGQWTWRFDPRMRLPNPVMYQMEHFRAFWQRISAPTLQVIGEESSFAAFAEPEHWNIPDMEIVAIPEAGHMIQHDAPEALARVVQDFLGQE